MAQAQGELYFGVKLNVYDVVAGQNDNVTNIISSINRVGRQVCRPKGRGSASYPLRGARQNHWNASWLYSCLII